MMIEKERYILVRHMEQEVSVARADPMQRMIGCKYPTTQATTHYFSRLVEKNWHEQITKATKFIYPEAMQYLREQLAKTPTAIFEIKKIFVA